MQKSLQNLKNGIIRGNRSSYDWQDDESVHVVGWGNHSVEATMAHSQKRHKSWLQSMLMLIKASNRAWSFSKWNWCLRHSLFLLFNKTSLCLRKTRSNCTQVVFFKKSIATHIEITFSEACIDQKDLSRKHKCRMWNKTSWGAIKRDTGEARVGQLVCLVTKFSDNRYDTSFCPVYKLSCCCCAWHFVNTYWS